MPKVSKAVIGTRLDQAVQRIESRKKRFGDGEEDGLVNR